MADDPKTPEVDETEAAQGTPEETSAAAPAAKPKRAPKKTSADEPAAKPKRAPKKASADEPAAKPKRAPKKASADEPAAKPKRTRRKKADDTPAGSDAPEAVTAKPEAPAKEVEELRRKSGDGDDAPARTAAAPATPAPAPRPARRRDRRDQAGVIVRAHAKYVRSSPRKARLVCDAIRGKDVAEARAILTFHPRAVSEAWIKLLESAVANAENNHDLDGDDLRISAVYADAGPTIKRFRPRAMGRATRIRKRTSHLTIQLTPKETR